MFGLEVISQQIQLCFLVKWSLGAPARRASLTFLPLPACISEGGLEFPMTLWEGERDGWKMDILVKQKVIEGFCRALLSLCDFWAASITNCVVDLHCLIAFVV